MYCLEYNFAFIFDKTKKIAISAAEKSGLLILENVMPNILLSVDEIIERIKSQ